MHTCPNVFEMKCFKVTVKTQQQCINISILLWQPVSVLLDHLQASIQRYEVQSVHISSYGIPCYIQGVHTKPSQTTAQLTHMSMSCF